MVLQSIAGGQSPHKGHSDDWRENMNEVANRSNSVPTAIQHQKIGAFWMTQLRHLNGFQKRLTPKEYGQLSYLERCLGARTRPVIEYALKNWWRFSQRAAAAAGTSP